MPNNSSDEDTSLYWKKLLKTGEPADPHLIKRMDTIFKPLRKPLRLAAKLLFSRFFSLSSEGLQNIPTEKAYIIASNHVSSMDFPAVFFCLPEDHQNRICAMYKRYYDGIPFARFFIKLFVPSFSVDMNKRPWEALSTAIKILKSGHCVFIAPEGTRSKNEGLLPFKPGIGAIAAETGAPIVPVYIAGSSKALSRGSFLPKKHPIKVVFGKAIITSKYSAMEKNMPAFDVYKALADEIRNEISVLSGFY